MRVGIGVLANAGDLPRDFHARLATRDLEAIVLDFLSDVDRRESSDRGELIAEVAVERAEPLRQIHPCLAVRIQHGVAVVDIHRVRRLDEAVVKVLVGRIERVIDLEGTAGFGKVALDCDIAISIYV